jgi:hypothetical protein
MDDDLVYVMVLENTLTITIAVIVSTWRCKRLLALGLVLGKHTILLNFQITKKEISFSCIHSVGNISRYSLD